MKKTIRMPIGANSFASSGEKKPSRAVSLLRRQIIAIQKKNYRKSANLVRQSLVTSPELKAYGAEYTRALRRYEGVSNKSDLIKRILGSDIVYHGDYHTLWQSQRSVLAVLQEIVEKREVVLCLELFHGADQRFVDQYLDGSLEEKAFLKKIDYARKWSYNWNPWRDILQFCRKHRIRVLGINSQMEDDGRMLAERDIYSAQIIGKALIRNPGALLYVVDGDFHICPRHLPREVQARLQPLGLNPKRLIIYQNSEYLYWKLAEAGLEEAGVLQISGDSYCLMNTVPADKLQSYLHWLECSEEGPPPVKGGWAELSGENYLRNVQNIVRDLDSLMRFNFPMESLHQLSVYSSRQLNLSDVVQSSPELKGSWGRIKDKIKRDEAFLLEYQVGVEVSYLIYLPHSNLDMAAEEAAHFMNCVLRGRTGPQAHGFDAFYANLIVEMLGFFGSKLINEKRKAPTESALRQYLGQVRQGFRGDGDRETTDVARLMLQHLHLDRTVQDEAAYRRKFRACFLDEATSRRLSTQLGYILGNKAFYAVKKGYLPLDEVRKLFYQKMSTKGEAFAIFQRLNRSLRAFRNPPAPEIQPLNLMATG